MNRSRSRSLRSIGIVAGGAVAALAVLAVPAEATTMVTGTVSAGRVGLNVRTGPSTAKGKVGKLATGSRITIVCQQKGQYISGRVRRTDRWDQLSNGRYVSDAYVNRPAEVALCSGSTLATGGGGRGGTSDKPSRSGTYPYNTGGTPIGTWVVPVASPTIVSGYRTVARPTHDGVDLAAKRNAPIHAAAAGTVIRVVCNTSGKSCDVDGSRKTKGCGWYTEIQHAGDVVTRYCHMIRRPLVNVGQVVRAGEIIGYAGTSGNSSGVHLHYEVHTDRPAVRANAVDPYDFMRRAHAPLD